MKIKKHVVILTTLLLVVLFTTGSIGNNIVNKKSESVFVERYKNPKGPILEVTTDKEIYNPGEMITIILTNIGDEILCGGGPVITIYNSEEEIVYQGGTYCWIQLEPEEFVTWIPWDQTNNEDEQVPPGEYIAEGFLSGYEVNFEDITIFHIA